MKLFIWLSIFESIFSFGYTCLIPLLLASWLMFKKYRKQILEILQITNGWFCIYAAISICQIVLNLFLEWYGYNQYEGYAFFSPNGTAISLFTSLIIIAISLLLVVICFALFLSKKYRSNMKVSILAWLSLNASFILFYVHGLIHPFRPRSYVSFSEKIVWYNSEVFHLLVYLTIIIGTYYLQQRQKISKQIETEL